jgi:hypothetical protein
MIKEKLCLYSGLKTIFSAPHPLKIYVISLPISQSQAYAILVHTSATLQIIKIADMQLQNLHNGTSALRQLSAADAHTYLNIFKNKKKKIEIVFAMRSGPHTE